MGWARPPSEGLAVQTRLPAPVGPVGAGSGWRGPSEVVAQAHWERRGGGHGGGPLRDRALPAGLSSWLGLAVDRGLLPHPPPAPRAAAEGPVGTERGNGANEAALRTSPPSESPAGGRAPTSPAGPRPARDPSHAHLRQRGQRRAALCLPPRQGRLAQQSSPRPRLRCPPPLPASVLSPPGVPWELLAWGTGHHVLCDPPHTGTNWGSQDEEKGLTPHPTPPALSHSPPDWVRG